MGPQGGDELNLILPGRNYGWPLFSFGNAYNGEHWDRPGSVPGFESPVTFWVPAISPFGLTFYSGDKFPKWKDSAFLGSLTYMYLERVVFNAQFQHVRRQWMLTELKQRIRDVRRGPDGYMLRPDGCQHGALLRIEPVTESRSIPKAISTWPCHRPRKRKTASTCFRPRDSRWRCCPRRRGL